MRAALIQMRVTDDKEHNLDIAAKHIAEAKSNGADMAVLPEMFCCPYSGKYFPAFAEERGGRIWSRLSRCARENKLLLIGGSMPERCGDKLFNTCFVFDETGRETAFHRKMHLFDIDIKGGQRFKESDTFAAGSDITVFDSAQGRFGVMICFDVRFPELARLMALDGAQAIIVPAAFNMTTGPMHWESTFRQRAVDNQLFMLGCAPARDESAEYVSYANSIAADPWGGVTARAGSGECVLFADIDLQGIHEAREQLPLLSARRTDVYSLTRTRLGE